MRLANLRMRGLDEARLAHAARAPQQRVVGWQPARKPLGVLDQLLRGPLDALQQLERHPVDLGDRLKAARLRGPNIRLSRLEIGRNRRLRGQSFQRVRDPRQRRQLKGGRAGVGFFDIHALRRVNRFKLLGLSRGVQGSKTPGLHYSRT